MLGIEETISKIRQLALEQRILLNDVLADELCKPSSLNNLESLDLINKITHVKDYSQQILSLINGDKNV